MWFLLWLKHPFAFQLAKLQNIEKASPQSEFFFLKSTFVTTDMLHKIHFKCTHTNFELSDLRIPVFCLHLKMRLNYTAKAARQESKRVHHEEERRCTEKASVFQTAACIFLLLSQ